MCSLLKKIYMIPYTSISVSVINFKPGKVELLFSFDSWYQLHVNFIDMNHDKKEVIKKANCYISIFNIFFL